ncbi:kinase-like domain-containing protein [Cantharellus anzutake]|uniref:kinase-like domain-containing protein n=1 Tax=Cantharellus anzutake TaxID=1750568 RepID=UPI001904CAA4|nr:kinase-like domain-containing protein [Cantharellus anzutake]KAF8316956.1 kinase-like domain-containing protein [Cantharellus anzutake]
MFGLGHELGRGKFARVHVARTKCPSMSTLALKVLCKSELDQNVEEQVQCEIETHKNLVHPNIICLYGSFDDKVRICLVLELAPKGTLFDRVLEWHRVPEQMSSQYIAQLTDALKYLHGKHIIYCNIDLENILVDVHGRVKLADFSYSTQTRNHQTTICGTTAYLAPEMVKNQPYLEKVDHWALGVLTYQLLTGKSPFTGRSKQDTYRWITEVDLWIPNHVSLDASNLIQRLLCKNPEDRLTLSEVKNHWWISRYQ